MSGLELESNVTKKIHIAMMNYLKNKRRNEKKAKTILDEEISEALKGSGLWMNEVHFDPLSEGVENYKERIKDRQKTLKRKRRLDFINKMVAYSISMEWQMNKNIKRWKYSPIKGLNLTVGAWAKFRKSMQFGSMSSTEQFIRSISFIIGIRRGQKLGYLPSGNPWDFDTNDRNRAISMGSNYQEFTNFGLSTQDVGQYNWGDMGKLTGKFKYWSQQKAGLDMRIIRDAIVSFKDFENIKGTRQDLIDSKAIYKLMKSLGQKGTHKTNPEASRFWRFLLWQGLPTVFFDFFISPVAFVPGVRGWFYKVPGLKPLRGLGSDVLSMALALPVTIPLRIFLGGVLFGDDEDPEKDVKDIYKYYMRKTYFGYVPIWSAESILQLAYTMMTSEETGKTLGTVASPVIPTYTLQKTAEKAVDTMLDN